MLMTVLPPSPQPRAAAARLRCVVESFESRLLMHAFAPIMPVDDIVRLNTDTPDVIDLSQSFNAAANPTRVAFEFDAGRVIVELYESAAPLSVANFLNYARTERYDDTVIHRSAILGAPTFEPFVVQGGGFRASDLVHIQTDSPVQNEFRPNTQQRGTIAMAKQGGNPNSATSEWFFNLRDNRDILDAQNGGFTSFGEVVGNGMTIVDAIAALPVIVQPAPAPFNELSDFPVENEPPTAPQDYVNVETVAELADLTGVTSDNPGLVTPVLQGTTLTLNYTAGVGGIANITISGVDRTGAPVTDVFQVRVPIISVPVGDGTPYRTFTYTDADGTAGAVTVTGGSATLRVSGTSMAQAPAGRNVSVTGADLVLASINITGGTPSISVRGAGGADRRLFVDGINGGAIRSFTGGDVILRGASNIEQGIGKLSVFRTEDATINIGPSPDGRLQPAIALGAAEDTDITSTAPIRSIRFGSWTSGDAEADVITAPFINTFQTGGDFPGGLTITGDPVGKTLNRVRIGGVVSGTWSVSGVATNLSLRSTAPTWAAEFGNHVSNLNVAGEMSGTVGANSIGSLRAGGMQGAVITLRQASVPGAMAVRSIRVLGAINNTGIRANASDIGTVSALAINGSRIFAGVSTPLALPTSAEGFVASTTIRSVTVRNRFAPSFNNSYIAASTLGKMNLGVINVDNGLVPFGLAANAVTSVSAVSQAGRISLRRLTEPNQSAIAGDFVVQVF